ncbi:hypothetical protein K8I61_00545 [bacterium]|nr:hypothetical protein [bacterium]
MKPRPGALRRLAGVVHWPAVVYYPAAFIASVVLYLALWSAIGHYAMTRAGHLVWLHSGADEMALNMRIVALRIAFGLVMPLVFGVVGVGWAKWWKIRTRLNG